jgi:hypothetical protein
VDLDGGVPLYFSTANGGGPWTSVFYGTSDATGDLYGVQACTP